MPTWQMRDAKRRLSELIECARLEGPQTIAKHGMPYAIVLSVETYNELVAQRPDFKAWLTGGPKLDDFSIERSRDAGRDIIF